MKIRKRLRDFVMGMRMRAPASLATVHCAWLPTMTLREAYLVYGFRPGRSTHDAVRAAQAYVKASKTWVVDLDISAFFDQVDHDILMHRVGQFERDKRVLRLIGRSLREWGASTSRWPRHPGALKASKAGYDATCASVSGFAGTSALRHVNYLASALVAALATLASTASRRASGTNLIVQSQSLTAWVHMFRSRRCGGTS